MAHIHRVYDTDTHFIIDPVTRKINSDLMQKSNLIQYDHNSERFTFEIPRYVEEHDMSLCDRIEIHFTNVSSDKKNQSSDVYIVNDMQIDTGDENVVIFSWLISQSATQYVGTLQFAIRFVCTNGESFDYVWSTGICSAISIAAGLFNTAVVLEETPDLVEQIAARAELSAKEYCSEVVGDIDVALDEIIAIQESYIGSEVSEDDDV